MRHHLFNSRRALRHVLCSVSLLCLTACGGGSSGGGGPLPPTQDVALPASTNAMWKKVCDDSSGTPPATPVDPSLSAGTCLNPALYRTAGTRTALVYSSMASGVAQQVWQFATVAETVACDGKPAGAINVREIVQTNGNPASETRFDGTHYVTLSDHRVQLLGTMSRYRSQGHTVTQTIMPNPPMTDLDFRLTAGSSTAPLNSVVTASVSPASGQGSATFHATGTLIFVGTETITVPAGTFTDACKFEQHVTTGTPRITTRWLAKGSGVVLRIESGGTTQQLVSGTLNGVAITP